MQSISPLAYNVIVSKKRMCVAILLSWVLSLHQVGIVQLQMEAMSLFVTSWVSLMVIFLISSYTYIILKVKKRRRKLSKSMPQTLRANIKYHVPLLIVLSFILLVLVPTLVVLVGRFYMNPWIGLIYKTNYTVDALIYLFNSARFQTCFKLSKTLSRSEKLTKSRINRIKKSVRQ